MAPKRGFRVHGRALTIRIGFLSSLLKLIIQLESEALGNDIGKPCKLQCIVRMLNLIQHGSKTFLPPVDWRGVEHGDTCLCSDPTNCCHCGRGEGDGISWKFVIQNN